MKIKTISAAAALAMVAGSAMAVPIVGTASITGFFDTYSATPNRIVSDLNTIDVSSAALVGGTTGNFAPNGIATASDFTIAPFAPGLIYTFNGFTFQVQSIASLQRTAPTCTTQGCADALAFDIFGTVSKVGFDNTLFQGQWTGNGSCGLNTATAGDCLPNTKSGSWSVSLSAAGQPVTIPEPSSLALVGLALAGLGLVASRKARG